MSNLVPCIDFILCFSRFGLRVPQRTNFNMRDMLPKFEKYDTDCGISSILMLFLKQAITTAQTNQVCVCMYDGYDLFL
jgi:hypothetical protein